MNYISIVLTLLCLANCATKRIGTHEKRIDFLDPFIATDFTEVFGNNLEKDDESMQRAVSYHKDLYKKDSANLDWKLALEHGVTLLSHAKNTEQMEQAADLFAAAINHSNIPNSTKIQANWLEKIALRQLAVSRQLAFEKALVDELKSKIEALSTIEQNLEQRESQSEP